MEAWRRLERERILGCRVFDVERVRLERPRDRAAREFYVLAAPEWVNVIPLTPEREVILVRQFRVGIGEVTLEIPGGMCDPGEAPEEAARRELLEEAGCEAARWEPLGAVHPNPALQGNRCHTFLAREVRPARGRAIQADPDEAFELVRCPLREVPRWIAEGRITHALVVAAFQLLAARGED